MSRSSTLILLGVLVILVPFSGLPASLRSLLAAVFGACVLGIGLSQRARAAREARISQSSTESPAESSQPPSSVSPI